MKPEIEYRPKPRSAGGSKSRRAVASDTQPVTPDPKSSDEVTAPAKGIKAVQSGQPPQVNPLEAIAAFAVGEALAKWGKRLRGRNDYQRELMRDSRAAQKLGLSLKQYRTKHKGPAT